MLPLGARTLGGRSVLVWPCRGRAVAWFEVDDGWTDRVIAAAWVQIVHPQLRHWPRATAGSARLETSLAPEPPNGTGGGGTIAKAPLLVVQVSCAIFSVRIRKKASSLCVCGGALMLSCFIRTNSIVLAPDDPVWGLPGIGLDASWGRPVCNGMG